MSQSLENRCLDSASPCLSFTLCERYKIWQRENQTFLHFPGHKQVHSWDASYWSWSSWLKRQEVVVHYSTGCIGWWTPEDWDWGAVEKEPFTDCCRVRMQKQIWLWKQLDASLCFASVYSGVLPFHYTICSSQWYGVCVSTCYYFLIPFSSAILLIFSPTRHDFPLFHQLLSFFFQLCSRSVLALILLVG